MLLFENNSFCHSWKSQLHCLNIPCITFLTHWGRVTHICVGKLTIIVADNDLSPERRQAIIGTNAGILLTGRLGTNFSEILIEIHTSSLKKIRLKMSSAKCCSFRVGLTVLSVIMNVHTGAGCDIARLPVLARGWHDDVIKWKHFPRYWPFVRGIHWSLVDK